MWWELAAILALALIVYRMYWSNSPKRPTKEGTAKLYFFHTEWCGFCKKAKPEWEQMGIFEYVCEENNRCPGGKCSK